MSLDKMFEDWADGHDVVKTKKRKATVGGTSLDDFIENQRREHIEQGINGYLNVKRGKGVSRRGGRRYQDRWKPSGARLPQGFIMKLREQAETLFSV